MKTSALLLPPPPPPSHVPNYRRRIKSYTYKFTIYIRIRYIHVYIVCIFLYTSGKYMPVCGTFIYTMIGKMFMVNEKLGRMNSSSLQLCIYRHHTHCWIVLLNSFLHFTPTQRTSQFQWYRNVTYSSLPPLPCLQVWNNLLLNSQLESIEIGSPF